MFYLELFFFLRNFTLSFSYFHFFFTLIKKYFQPTPSPIPFFLALFISSQYFLQLPQSLLVFQLSKCLASYRKWWCFKSTREGTHANFFVILVSFYLSPNDKTTSSSKRSWVSRRRLAAFQYLWTGPGTSSTTCRKTAFWGLISRIISVSIKILSLPQDGESPCMKQIRDSGSFFIRRPMKNSLPKSSARMKAPYFRKPTSYGVNSTHSANTCSNNISSTTKTSQVTRCQINLSGVSPCRQASLVHALSKPCWQPLLDQLSHCLQVCERAVSGLRESLNCSFFLSSKWAVFSLQVD